MKVSRRQCVGWIGATVALAPTVAAASAGREVPEEPTEPACAAVLSASVLLHPLVIGSQIGSWRIEGLGQLHAGAVSVQLSGVDGEKFHIDICARDDVPGAPVPPARTDLCDLFVANEGAGSDPTKEDQGLAAMALAEVIRSHEHRVVLHGLLTLRARLEFHGDCVVRRCVEG